MKIEQIYTGCLAEAAYYIESDGEAAIIDPLRETKPYLDRAAADGAMIKYVFETHFHADFVSGHLDLANASGARIVYGPTAKPAFEAVVARDGQSFQLGRLRIKVLYTPGHTMESSSFLLYDEQDRPHAVFTGDTLFIGDVGRPDLAVKSDLTREDLAGLLYDSLRDKIMVLPDDLIVYPGHGAGSACGKKLARETIDTLGHQKATNYALRADMGKEEFVRSVLDGLVEPPQYFPKNAVMNQSGYRAFEEIKANGLRPLAPKAFAEAADAADALILDTRHEAEFAKTHIPGSIFIGIHGSFAPWVGALITDLQQPILIVAHPDKVEEVVTRLSRVGYDNPLGYLSGGMEAWFAEGMETDSVCSISASAFADIFRSERPPVLDVRKESEFESQHLAGAENFPLDFINRNMGRLDRDALYFVHCAGGYRSMIAVSILQARGFRRLTNVEGGIKAIEAAGLELTAFAEQATDL